MKKLIKKLRLPLLLFVAIGGMSFTHKFYVSVTNVNYAKEAKALQITTRIFIDDLDDLMMARYGVATKLATKNEAKVADAYIEKYLKTKVSFELDGQVKPFTFIGKKYDADVIICYLEVPNVTLEGHENLTVTNEILTDLYDEQKNLVHVKWNGNKKSFVLIKSDIKGMLKL